MTDAADRRLAPILPRHWGERPAFETDAPTGMRRGQERVRSTVQADVEPARVRLRRAAAVLRPDRRLSDPLMVATTSLSCAATSLTVAITSLSCAATSLTVAITSLLNAQRSEAVQG